MANPLEGFKEFVLRGNVVSMAVGIIIGASFEKIVGALVDGVINPVIAAAVGEPNFDELALGPVQYGLVLTALINFLLIALVIYFFFVVPMNRLMDKEEAEEEAAPEEPSAEEKLLVEIRDALVAQNRDA